MPFSLVTGIVWLLPGLTLTIAMQELAAYSFVAGTARMFYAVLMLLELGFGNGVMTISLSSLLFKAKQTVLQAWLLEAV